MIEMMQCNKRNICKDFQYLNLFHFESVELVFIFYQISIVLNNEMTIKKNNVAKQQTHTHIHRPEHQHQKQKTKKKFPATNDDRK